MIAQCRGFRRLTPVLVAAVLITGCSSKEPPADKGKAAPSPTAAAPSTTAPTGTAAMGKAAPTASAPAAPAGVPAVSAAEQQTLAEVVAMIPADAIALGTFSNPNIMVGRLDAYAGPEIATVPGILLSFLPAEIIDMKPPWPGRSCPRRQKPGSA